ncbi:MAG TPA: type II toxin-antitoxin system RatA family toxin [Sphingomonadales bacterium]|nr:type II toxin-antitoxin system RatA family toxin [Sphingomonadales bacterium]
MPRHAEQRVLPYPTGFIFDVVLGVEYYPDFLPWCRASRVYGRKEGEFMADLVIGFRMLRETWTSRVHYEKPARIAVDYIKGPMKYLHNEWTFSPHAEGTIVDFVIDFEFKNPLFEKIAGGLFEEAVHRMMAAFERRVEILAGRKRPLP